MACRNSGSSPAGLKPTSTSELPSAGACCFSRGIHEMKRDGNDRTNFQNLITYFLLFFCISGIGLFAVLSFYYGPQAENLGRIFSDNAFYFIMLAFICIFAAVLLTTRNIVNSRMKYYREFDSMTKAYNRITGLKKLALCMPHDDRRNARLSVCYIDINGLKEVNEVLGHEVGDELVITVVDEINSIIRDSDFVVRLSGDAFLIVFVNAGAQEAEKVWARIREKYAEDSAQQTRPYVISVSHGIVDRDASIFRDLDDLIMTAEKIMETEKKEMQKELKIIKEQKK